jgi:hypothetical protein
VRLRDHMNALRSVLNERAVRSALDTAARGGRRGWQGLRRGP